MIFYLFSREETGRLFDRLGYAFTPQQIIGQHRLLTFEARVLARLDPGPSSRHAWVLGSFRTARRPGGSPSRRSIPTSRRPGRTTGRRAFQSRAPWRARVDLVQLCVHRHSPMERGRARPQPAPARECCRGWRPPCRFRRQILGPFEITQETLTSRARSMTAAAGGRSPIAGTFGEISPCSASPSSSCAKRAGALVRNRSNQGRGLNERTRAWLLPLSEL